MVIQFVKADEPKKSTAARKDVPDLDRMLQRQMTGTLNPPSPSLVAASIEQSELTEPCVADKVEPAGTQALPVGTHSKAKRGRPKTDFDKAEYNRQFMRDLRTIKRLGLSVTVKQYRESLK